MIIVVSHSVFLKKMLQFLWQVFEPELGVNSMGMGNIKKTTSTTTTSRWIHFLLWLKKNGTKKSSGIPPKHSV